MRFIDYERQATIIIIFSNHDIHSITTLHLEVPCCNGITDVINQALEKSGKKITVKDSTITIDGRII